MSSGHERLRDGRDVAAVLRARRSRAGRLAVVHVLERDDEQPARLAFVASRRVGDAVSRNRAKRVLREAAARTTWRAGTDVVLVARAACAETGMWDVHDDLLDVVRRLDVGAPTVIDVTEQGTST